LISISGPAERIAPSSLSCWAKLARASLALFAVVTALGISAWLGREPLLRWTADLWIVSDPLGPADAVAVFGGGLGDRPFAAAAFYREGLVKKVLVSNVHVGPAEKLGVTRSQTAATNEILVKLGVPASDIEAFGDDLGNTHQEVLALRAWAERNGARTIIVPTEIFSARRVRWMLRRAFGDAVAISVPALDPGEYQEDDWWKHEAGLIAFQNEVLKYLYYRIKY
jgi:uncharacterized SAM-binding protein YcdF (DUF218 family)